MTSNETKTIDLLRDMTANADSLSTHVSEWYTRAKKIGDTSYANGISLLSLKNMHLLSYVQHLVAIAAVKLDARSLLEGSLDSDSGAVDASPAGAVHKLVQLRIVLEKIAPLETKLKYQIDKLISHVNESNKNTSDADLLKNEINFKPNPASFAQGDDSESESDEESHAESSAARDNVYRPPKMNFVPYTDDEPRKKDDFQKKSNMLADMSRSITSAHAPIGESTSGLGATTDSALVSNAARRVQRQDDFEQENFRRLRMSKKDLKRRRSDERGVAFGTDSKNIGGFENEFREWLHEGPKSRRENENAYSTMGTMRAPKKSKSTASATPSAFKKAMKKTRR